MASGYDSNIIYIVINHVRIVFEHYLGKLRKAVDGELGDQIQGWVHCGQSLDSQLLCNRLAQLRAVIGEVVPRKSSAYLIDDSRRKYMRVDQSHISNFPQTYQMADIWEIAVRRVIRHI